MNILTDKDGNEFELVPKGRYGTQRTYVLMKVGKPKAKKPDAMIIGNVIQIFIDDLNTKQRHVLKEAIEALMEYVFSNDLKAAGLMGDLDETALKARSLIQDPLEADKSLTAQKSKVKRG